MADKTAEEIYYWLPFASGLNARVLVTKRGSWSQVFRARTAETGDESATSPLVNNIILHNALCFVKTVCEN